MTSTLVGPAQPEHTVSGRDAGAMIDWLCTAFGLVVRLKADGGVAAEPGATPDSTTTASSLRPGRSTALRPWPNPAS